MPFDIMIGFCVISEAVMSVDWIAMLALKYFL